MEFEKIRDILSESLMIDQDLITMESDLVENLGADSLDLVEFVMDLEDTFDVEISDEVFASVSTVADVVALVKKVTN